MRIFILFLFNIALLIAPLISKGEELSSTFNLIRDYKGSMSKPLGKQYSEGAKIFSKSNGKKEAEAIYKSQGFAFVRLKATLVPPGITDFKLPQKLADERGAMIITIPATGDVVKAGSKEYQNAASEYASDFNKQMYQYYLSTISTKECDGVNKVDIKPLEKYEKYYVKHLKKEMSDVQKVKVLEAYEYEGWRIIYVDTFVSDEPYLFYKGMPSDGPFLTFWSGAATYFETEETDAYIQKEAKGIPAKLSKCFAHMVTLGK
jgi:hypothetical protein